MTIKELYERVCLRTDTEQRRFFDFLNDSITELRAMYPGFTDEKEFGEHVYSPADGGFHVLPLYHEAIADNIIFLSGEDEFYKSEFLRKSREAYHAYWSKNAKGRRMKIRTR